MTEYIRKEWSWTF